ncbi:phosphomannomutase [Catenovulum sp. 2E275]|uniref:phosphomannomutase n=1 Tax=Catenovulum sp. 2E275 TaxID=2980497 RepID=UPI0021D1759F|nr:phosphomannomutase [Catenovulum sp. 2E275]MCU4675018.1 phosphomannomutase [Catenovulum sp. 2E275]
MTQLITKNVLENSGVKFGTSGARGLVTDFTADVCAAFTHAFIAAMQQNFEFDTIAIAIDNRPSSYAMAQACSAALEQANLKTVYYGVVPTPALAYAAMQADIPSIMVTGSHIPFDRNGLKFYRPDGEITKAEEQTINTAAVEFTALTDLPELITDTAAAQLYIARYTRLFDQSFLAGKHIGIYEHSSAGRDLYQDLFTQLGAKVTPLERSDQFVPIDTEAVSEADKEKALAWSKEFGFDLIFSTDGDGDRPLLAGEDGKWLRGDILGLLCAQALNIDALAVPVSCNTAIELSCVFKKVERTSIGSPYVIAEFEQLNQEFSSVAGFEANGGFLLGSDIQINGQTLKALPTRDAVLPALMLLAASKEKTVVSLLDVLPARYTHSDRIQNFATEKSLTIINQAKDKPEALLKKLGFEAPTIANVNTTDGLRLTLADGNIVHLRPSGNAPELRCYAESDSVEMAVKLANQVLEKLKAEF